MYVDKSNILNEYDTATECSLHCEILLSLLFIIQTQFVLITHHYISHDI